VQARRLTHEAKGAITNMFILKSVWEEIKPPVKTTAKVRFQIDEVTLEEQIRQLEQSLKEEKDLITQLNEENLKFNRYSKIIHKKTTYSKIRLLIKRSSSKLKNYAKICCSRSSKKKKKLFTKSFSCK
jgi:hypothetical protein